jgi:hypothetical protein
MSSHMAWAYPVPKRWLWVQSYLLTILSLVVTADVSWITIGISAVARKVPGSQADSAPLSPRAIFGDVRAPGWQHREKGVGPGDQPTAVDIGQVFDRISEPEINRSRLIARERLPHRDQCRDMGIARCNQAGEFPPLHQVSPT